MIRTIAGAAAEMRAGTLRSEELIEASLAAIDVHGPRTNAFISVDAEGARASARKTDDERRRGIDRGALHGIPISLKDLIDVAGQPTTAASRVRDGHIASRDALVVQRLRDAGAVIIGKTNLHEFAFGTTSEESAYGAVRNPHDTSRSAGGSSGGSAAAVATGMGLASIGSDTGGSIRIPAAACGVVGLKPSLGEVPLDGIVPLAASFDHVGPLTRTVRDAAVLWGVLSGRGLRAIEPPSPAPLVLGDLRGYFQELLSADVRAAYEDALARLRAAGTSIEERTIDNTDRIMDTYVNISLPEIACWHAATYEQRPEDYQPAVRARLALGPTITAMSHLQARAMRTRFTRAVDMALEGCHALVLPTLPMVAPALGAANVELDNGESIPVRSAMLRLTQLFNITGHPAISLPLPGGGLPIGLQLVGRRDATEDLLAVGERCEAGLGERFNLGDVHGASGRLNELADEALADHAAGRSRKL